MYVYIYIYIYTYMWLHLDVRNGGDPGLGVSSTTCLTHVCSSKVASNVAN